MNVIGVGLTTGAGAAAGDESVTGRFKGRTQALSAPPIAGDELPVAAAAESVGDSSGLDGEAEGDATLRHWRFSIGSERTGVVLPTGAVRLLPKSKDVGRDSRELGGGRGRGAAGREELGPAQKRSVSREFFG